MFFAIIIVLISLVSLATLHELGHFLLAKKFGVRVDEFGIGYPPRLISKKMGGTIYSLNLLPFGAFVRLPGESKRMDDPESFSEQPVWQRILIALGGVFSFWIIAIVIFSVVFSIGSTVAIDDSINSSDLINPKVQIVDISMDSPAEEAGLKIGDSIEKMSINDTEVFPLKVREIQDFVDNYLGEKITLTINRGEETLKISLVPRVSPPEGEGSLGVALTRTAVQKYPWYIAPWQGFLTAGRLTIAIANGYAMAIKNIFLGAPSGVEMIGPVGVFNALAQTQQLGATYFLNFLALICLYLAVFNLLPIPALDGGKVAFLIIEAIRKKPVSEKIEEKITLASFALLLLMMVWVTVKDVVNLF